MGISLVYAMKELGTQKRAGGRPPKFDEPRRAVTVTLPDRTLRQLRSIHPDRARAIAKVTETVVGAHEPAWKRVELVEIAPGQAVIVVGPCASLRRVPWLKLVEIAPGRNLLIIPSGTAVESLEIAILDLLETLGDAERDERPLLQELRGELGRLRRQHRVSKAEIIFFDTSDSGTRRASRQS